MQYYTREMLGKLKALDEEKFEAICVAGEDEDGSFKGLTLFYVDGKLNVEEPDGNSYGCHEQSVPEDLVWVIVKV